MPSTPKIALCISGQPRSYEIGHQFIKKNLLELYNVDVFFHTWNNDHTNFNKLIKLYNPKKYIVEPALENTIDQKYTRIPSQKFPAYFTVSAFYSIFTANQIKKEYEIDNNFLYDWVIRIRFDYALNAEPDFSILDSNKIYIPNCRMVPERNFGNDQFAIGSSKVIDNYSSTFLYLDYFYSNDITMIGEEMLKANLIKHNLIGENLVYVDMNNPFPPGPHNGTWHSLIREDYENWAAKQ